MKIATAMMFAAFGLHAQDANLLIAEAREAYAEVRNNILKSAEKMPEDYYGFKPAPRVRTFGQILGHLAEEQYFFCGAVKGEQKAADVEKSKTAKADILASLRESFAYCDAAYAGLTDATAVRRVGSDGKGSTRLRMLWANTAHDNSHYGNLVTYLRIKGLVPPSTEGQ